MEKLKGYMHEDNNDDLLASELVACLEKMISEHGDLPVFGASVVDEADFLPRYLYAYHQGATPTKKKPAQYFYIHGVFGPCDARVGSGS